MSRVDRVTADSHETTEKNSFWILLDTRRMGVIHNVQRGFGRSGPREQHSSPRFRPESPGRARMRCGCQASSQRAPRHAGRDLLRILIEDRRRRGPGRARFLIAGGCRACLHIVKLRYRFDDPIDGVN